MNKQTLENQIHELSVICGMNQRFHQKLQGRYERRDRILQVVLAGFTTLGLILSCVPSETTGAISYWAGIVLSAVSVVLAVAVNIAPYSRIAAEHKALFVRWCDLRIAVDILAIRTEADARESIKEYVERLVELSRWRESIDATEPPPDDALLSQCQVAEHHARGLSQGESPLVA